MMVVWAVKLTFLPKHLTQNAKISELGDGAAAPVDISDPGWEKRYLRLKIHLMVFS